MRVIGSILTSAAVGVMFGGLIGMLLTDQVATYGIVAGAAFVLSIVIANVFAKIRKRSAAGPVPGFVGTPNTYGTAQGYGAPSTAVGPDGRPYPPPPPAPLPGYGAPAAPYSAMPYAAPSPVVGQPVPAPYLDPSRPFVGQNGQPGANPNVAYGAPYGMAPGAGTQQGAPGSRRGLGCLISLIVVVLAAYLTLLPSWPMVTTSWGYLTSQPADFISARFKGEMVPGASSSGSSTSGVSTSGSNGSQGNPGASANSSASPSDSAAPVGHPQNLLTADGISWTIAQLTNAAGGTAISSMYIYPSYAGSTMPFPENGDRMFDCSVDIRYGESASCEKDPKSSSSRFYVRDFDASEVDPNIVASVLGAAQAGPDFDPSGSSYVVISGSISSVDDPIRIVAYASTTWGDSNYVIANLDGTVTYQSW